MKGVFTLLEKISDKKNSVTNKLNFPIKTTILISSPGLLCMIYWTKNSNGIIEQELPLSIGPSFRKQTISQIEATKNEVMLFSYLCSVV